MTEETDSGNDSGTGSESELGDFESDPAPPQPGEADPTKAANQPDVDQRVAALRQRSEHDREIRPGDPVRDLWGGGWLIAVKKAADTVREYDSQQADTKKSLLEYEGSKCMGATEEDTVWQCFYINQNNTLAGGRSGPYGFPESRICRYAYEATDGYKNGRFQDHHRLQVLEQVIRQFPNFQAQADEAATLFEAISSAFGEETASEAFELAEASDH